MDGSFLPRSLTAGVYQIPAEEYHADPCPEPSLSSTLAKTMLAQSPLHAWTASPKLNPDWEPVEKKIFDIGRAAHRAVLGAGGDYVAIPDDMLSTDGKATTKAAKEFCAQSRSEGLTPIKEVEKRGIEAMLSVSLDRLGRMGIILDPARSEQVALAQIGGVWCRAMMDNVPLDARQPIYDLKTCENANPEACQKAVLNYGYDVQAAHYREVWRAATGEDRAFRFIFQEKSAPHEICVVELGRETLELAGRKIARAREMWALCLRDGVWPGYPAGVHMIDLPAWAFDRWFDRETVETQHKRQHGSDILEAAMRFLAPEVAKGASA